MNIQIETVTLKDGSKIDVIRDIKAVRKLIESHPQLRFESWITEEHGISTSKYKHGEKWPGQYKHFAVQLAWEAWCKVINDKS